MGNRNELLGFVGILLVLIIGIGIAQSQEDEIMQLEQELIDAGYDWLVDYSGGKNI